MDIAMLDSERWANQLAKRMKELFEGEIKTAAGYLSDEVQKL